jgi:hypothetical protein
MQEYKAAQEVVDDEQEKKCLSQNHVKKYYDITIKFINSGDILLNGFITYCNQGLRQPQKIAA